MTTPTVRLTNADDIFAGTDRAEEVLGLGGSDMIFGRGGDDRLFSYDETSFSMWYDRTLTDKASHIDGGAGNDEIESYGTERAVGFGGTGDDSVFVRSYGTARGSGGAGNDLLGVSGEHGDAWASGGPGDDVIAVKARYGMAVGLGGAGNDELSVDHSARGKLVGGAGDDLMVVTGAGKGQVTTMIGGHGRDVMQGEDDGIEIYRFKEGHTGTGLRADVIRVFGEEDVIDLSVIDANGGANGDGAFKWVGRNADPRPGEVGYHETTIDGAHAVVVTFDYGQGDQEIVLFQPHDTHLSAADFML